MGISEEEHKLDNHFRSLRDFEAEPDPALWSEISASLPKKLFWRWGLRHFNVYYAGTIALVLVSACWYAFTQPAPSASPDQPKMEIPKDTVSSQNEIKPDLILVEPKTKTKKGTLENTTTADSTSNAQSIKDSLQMPVAVDQVSTKPDSTPVKIKEKKVVNIVRRDTLRIQDSLRIKKKRWQK